MAEDEKDAAAPPSYELIGPEVLDDSPDADDDGGPPFAGHAAAALRKAMNDFLRSLRSARFWLTAVVAVLVCWGGGVLLVIVAVTGGDYPPDVHGWGYILTAAMLTLAGALLGVRWGLGPAHAEPAPEQEPGELNGPLSRWLAAAARGLVFTGLGVVLLLLLAISSGAPAATAGVVAVMIPVEILVFSGIGAGASSWFRPRLARAAAWTTAATLVVGNVVAVIALLPTVRAYEPVVVAINLQRDALGRTISYECSPEFRGIAEVFHTERIFWLAAANPLMIFALLAGEASPQEDSLGWLPGELQSAAEGTQLPCMNGEPREESGVHLPLALSGFVMQSAIAGVFLVAGNSSSRRRRVALLG